MTRNPRTANGHRRRELVKRVKAQGKPCWLCTRPIDLALTTPHPHSFELHEIIPVSRGGSPIDPNNVAPTHRACNQWIGNRTPNELARDTRAKPTPTTTTYNW